MSKAIAFIPELKFEYAITRKIKLSEHIYLLPEEHTLARDIRKDIKSKGHDISKGSYLYFEGSLKNDGTLYEIFLGYAIALTLFNPKGRATCRAIKDLDSNDTQLFIDEYDKFGYEPEDVITLKKEKINQVKNIYSRVEAQLENKDFNPLRNSLEFFILFLSEKQIRTRLLYLSICLESVLLEGEDEGLSYKLGVRCANLLNAFYTKVDMNSVSKEIKNGYSLRSKIIHGDDYNKASKTIINKGGAATELGHVLRLEAIVKDVLSVIFSSQDFHDLSIKGDLGKTIDQKYILS
jgi:hypothetical protein